ncbi:hypothetical protein EZS27_015123 [termite gut metagenome]|uniref:HIT domain-containing protein n=1 Tax=termite gut metagenome TaxID=433724 RepID=A0A5J4RUV8_9ZZZZ
MESECVLCDIVKDISRRRKQIENTILYEDNNFVIIPALGPLYSGHVLIVSKQHYKNIAQMPLYAINECLSLMNSITNQLKETFPNMIFSEHGACSEEERGGCCIIHAHLQCIPLENNESLNNIDLFVEKTSISNFSEVITYNKPYLYINKHGTHNFYISEQVPSQLIRKIIYANNGRTDWDWKEDKKPNMIHETIELWKNFK